MNQERLKNLGWFWAVSIGDKIRYENAGTWPKRTHLQPVHGGFERASPASYTFPGSTRAGMATPIGSSMEYSKGQASLTPYTFISLISHLNMAPGGDSHTPRIMIHLTTDVLRPGDSPCRRSLLLIPYFFAVSFLVLPWDFVSKETSSGILTEIEIIFSSFNESRG